MSQDKKAAASRARLQEQEAAAVWVRLDALTPWENNPRVNDAAVPHVAKSITRFGFASPIIARKEDGEIIAGHTRLKAAQSLGLETVPVRYMDLDPADAHLLAVADNKLNEKALWDEALVADVLSDFSLEDAELAGFDSDELEKLGNDLLAAGSISEEDAFGALPDGDREPFQQMAFILHDEQVELVKAAIDHAKSLGSFSGPNENSNGNALARICEAFRG